MDPSGRHERTLPSLLARGFLVLGVLTAGVAIGGVHTQALAFVSAFSGLAMGFAFLAPGARPFLPKPSATAIVALGAGLVAFTWATTLPLPRGIVASLAPATADVWDRCLRGFGEGGPSLVTLSLDPTATRVEVLRGLTYLMVFATAHRMTHAQGGTELLERIVVGAALFMAAATILHPVVGAEQVLGLYRPKSEFGTHIAPILNANHLSGYLNLGLATGLGVLAGARSSRERLVVLGVVLFLLGMELYVGSRAGVASTLLSALVVGVLYQRLRRGQRAGLRAAPVLVFAAMAVGVGLLVVASSEQARVELGSRDVSKLETIRQSFRIVPPHFVFGVGRGAFESVFPAYRTGEGFVTVTHPENVVAQWSTEWGIPAAILAFVLLARALAPKEVLSRAKPPLGAYAALIGLAVHNLVDFSTELPGAMVLASVCAAIVTGGSADPASRTRRPAWARASRPFAAVVLALVGVAMVMALSGAKGELYADQDALRHAALDKGVPRAAFDARLRAASLRHPGEPYFPYVAALRGQALRDGPILPFAARALERSPTYGPVHLVLARTFYRSIPSQARLEYRLAMAQQFAEGFENEAPRLVSDFDEAMELVPDNSQGPNALEFLARKLGDRLPATRVMLDEELLRRAPRSEGALTRLAHDVLLDLRQDAPWCHDRRACEARGQELAARLRDVSPNTCEGYAIAAEIRAAAGSPKDAIHDLEEASARVDDRTDCLMRLVQLMDATGQTNEIDATIDRVANAGCVSPGECVEQFAFAARTLVERGKPRRAVAFYRKAVDRAPDNDDLLLEYARLASELELHAETLHAYTRLSELHPEVPEYAKRVAEEKDNLARLRFAPGVGGGVP
jgi:tetratricopeptide (TPR) repeat protein